MEIITLQARKINLKCRKLEVTIDKRLEPEEEMVDYLVILLWIFQVNIKLTNLALTLERADSLEPENNRKDRIVSMKRSRSRA